MARRNHFVGALAAVAGATLVAAGLVVLTLLVVDVGPAEATFPGKNGRIAFSGGDGHDREIYTIYPGGGGRYQVTHNKTRDVAPSYSPSGKRIAYSAGEDEKPLHHGPNRTWDLEIYTINATGGKSFQVTNNKPWDPRYGGSADDYAPTYSPDGKKIAFLGVPGEGQKIYTINVGGGRRAVVSPGPWDHALGDFDYSPSGKKIAYVLWGNIETINATGGGKSVVPPFEPNRIGPAASLSYSTDGKRIAYAAFDGPWSSGDYEIYTIPAGGGKPVQVTHNSTDDHDPSWGSRP